MGGNELLPRQAGMRLISSREVDGTMRLGVVVAFEPLQELEVVQGASLDELGDLDVLGDLQLVEDALQHL